MTTTTNLSLLSALRTLAANHLDHLDQQRQAAEQRRRDAEAAYRRDQIAISRSDAIAFLATNLPATLGEVVSDDQWTGYPGRPSLGTHTAAAPLGEGIWVLYHEAITNYTVDVGIHLVVPCPCGAYIEILCEDDQALAIALDGIDRWQAAPDTCTQACSPATWPELPKEAR
ncbi:hypothetical protein ACEZCY_35820 [Streptacidiphilus sp. N1-12]|uniref:Uncharacterized protein n=1 Tax=Streptacidiphilus alkalitolerans TaxID=3342712 RepID=A0ABV6WRD9_9ACTN